MLKLKVSLIAINWFKMFIQCQLLEFELIHFRNSQFTIDVYIFLLLYIVKYSLYNFF